MKSPRSILSILVAMSMLLLAGCKAAEPASNTAVKPSPADNSNKDAASTERNANSSKQSELSAAAKPAGPAQLIGTYESREVHSEGVVTLISQLKTLWVFSADGQYSRVSQVKGRPYHADAGMFRIEAPDKLLLTIQVTGPRTNRHIQNPPLSATHTFSLSADGDELRLTSDKGSVAIFERVAKPKTP